MNPSWTSDALVLHSRDRRDVDRLYILYTEEHGRVSAVGMSVRKPTSKLAGHLASPGIVRVFCAKGKNHDRLAGAQFREPWTWISTSADGLQTYARFLTVVNIAAPVPTPDPVFYCLAKGAGVSFDRMLRDGNNKAALQLRLDRFVFDVLIHSGFQPVLDQCVICRSKQKELNHFSIQNGGMVCHDCESSHLPLFPIPSRLFQFLRQMVFEHQNPTNEKSQLRTLSIVTARQFFDLVEQLFQFHYSQPY